MFCWKRERLRASSRPDDRRTGLYIYTYINSSVKRVVKDYLLYMLRSVRRERVCDIRRRDRKVHDVASKRISHGRNVPVPSSGISLYAGGAPIRGDGVMMGDISPPPRALFFLYFKHDFECHFINITCSFYVSIVNKARRSSLSHPLSSPV